MATDEAELNIREQITPIDHAIAATAKYAAEQRELEAEARNCATSGSSLSPR